MVISTLCCLLLTTVPGHPALTPLGDGYSRFVTAHYAVDVPTGWTVSVGDFVGQWSFSPVQGEGGLRVTLLPESRGNWHQIYEAALGVILRDLPGNPTPFVLLRRADGTECASFDVLDSFDSPSRRFVLIRDSDRGIVALSVRIPKPSLSKVWTNHLKRIALTAQFRGSRRPSPLTS